MTIKVHDLKPAPGLEQARQARRAAASPARAARPPAAAPRARRRAATCPPASRVARCRCTCACPKLQGLQQPVPRRVPGRQPRHHRGVRARRGHPRVAARQGPDRQGCPGQGPRPGRAVAEGHGQGARLLEVRRGGDHRGRWYGRGAAPAVGRSAPAGEGQPVREPLRRRSPGSHPLHRGAIAPRCPLPARLARTPRGVLGSVDASQGEQTCFPACGTCSGSRTSGTRSCSRWRSSPSTAWARTSRPPASTWTRSSSSSGSRKSPAACWPTCSSSRAPV